MGRILLGMAISRTANAMVSVAIVLFALDHYRSPGIAGLVTFCSIAPGLLVSPVAGALLDRHGRARLIVLDLLVADASMALIGGLAVADALPWPLLTVIVAVASLTQPLSATGLRSLFPLLVPKHLWDRTNAMDSNGYVIATLVGPPVAGAVVQVLGGPVALFAIGVVYALAGIVLIGIPDPRSDSPTTGSLWRDAWQGIVYTLSNPTLRALAGGLSLANLAGGIQTLVIPIIVIGRLGAGEATVGAVYAVSGITGGIAALLVGRIDSRGREPAMLVIPLAAMGLSWAALLFLPLSMPLLVGALAFSGACNGITDVALFSLRQRRTDPTLLGRAFAVSMSLNFAGYPIGSAVGGVLVAGSLEAALAVGLVVCVASGLLLLLLLPRESRPKEPGAPAAAAEIQVE